MIYMYPMDFTGCGMYRLCWPAQVLDYEGERIKIIPPGGNAGILSRMVKGITVGVTGIPDDCDTVILQRPTSVPLVTSIPYIQKLGVKVIIDVDDDLELLSARHPTWQMLQTLPGHDARAIRLACMMADVVTVSTPALLERMAPDGKGHLLRNCLPRRFFDLDLPGPTYEHVGWPGAIGTHPDDLMTVGNALARVGLPVRVVGPEHERGKALLGVEPEFTGKVEFEDWIPAVSTIHTGIAPLEPIAFNTAKSWLKPLEFAAARVPFVCSATPEYLELGAGLDASKPKEWHRQLMRLLKEPGLREAEIERNYQIARKWVVEDHVDAWASAWGL